MGGGGPHAHTGSGVSAAAGSTDLEMPSGDWDQLAPTPSLRDTRSARCPKELQNLHLKGPDRFPEEVPGEQIALDGQPLSPFPLFPVRSWEIGSAEWRGDTNLRVP